MWRVLKNISKKVESCVRVNQNFTDWINLETGVRQGCVLSPLLYALFINGLVSKLREAKLGVPLTEEKTLEVLLFADDIVLIAENKHKLQKMLNIVAEYAKKWRFEINPTKSGVVVFGKRYAPRRLTLTVGDLQIPLVSCYKYLGIELTRTLRWKPYTERILEKAYRNMHKTWAMGVLGGWLSVNTSVIIWKSVVRSVLEYGCEIWGESVLPQFEKIQLEMGRKILRCGPRMNGEVIQGELGWWSMRARRDELRLRYWRKILEMEPERIPRLLYEQSRTRLEAEIKEDNIRTKTWCEYTKRLLDELGLTVYWRENKVPDEAKWESLVEERIQAREQKKWLEKIKERPKLRTYVLFKKKLEQEKYLTSKDRYGRAEMVRLRGGTNRLKIEKGRYAQLPPELRVCDFCDTGEVEDEKHFLLHCPLYTVPRQELWKRVWSFLPRRIVKLTPEAQLRTILTAGRDPELLKVALKFIKQAMKLRRGIEKEREKEEEKKKEKEQKTKSRKTK
jgi:hypothetical protein